MISFTSFPTAQDAFKKQTLEEEDDDMDVDEDFMEHGATKLAWPGESLTSAQAYMRYNPEVGDLVIGRITEVQARRWKVEANSRQDAVLMLSSVNLPGGVQRRKLESDELQMRTFFEEGDLLVAEVQSFFGDGTMSLHTRSLSYGKLRNGQLVAVPPILVRRLKSHFISLPCGVDLILGLNGYIWISRHVKESEREGEEGFDAEAVYSNRNDTIDESTRTAISRVANIISVLASHSVPLNDTVLLEAYEWSVEQEGGPKALLQDDVGDALVATVVARG
ncbi:Exosome complex component rrp4 [Marasmius crinis-equi]|uniref:Exosome complex component rrp4 n=1 Tax=Marasmius crinis-equi TaxID=585013 RepID=A0ABR3G1T5_9AGAR